MQDDFEYVGSIKVKDGLYMGDEFSAQDIEQLTINKINYVINCAGKDSYNYWENEGITYMTINWQDSDQQVLFEPKGNLLNQIYEFIEIALNKGESVLIHSARGQNRCTGATVAYLMKKYRWSLRKSLEYLRAKRPNIPLRPSFFNQLLSLENRLFQMALEGRTDSWNEVSDIPGSDELVVTHTFLNTKIIGAEKSISDVSTAKSSKIGSKISWSEQLTSQVEITIHSEEDIDEDYGDSELKEEEEEEIQSKTSLNGLLSEQEQPDSATLSYTVKSSPDRIGSKSILKSESRFTSPTLTIRKVVSASATTISDTTEKRENARADAPKSKVIRKVRPSSSSTHTRTTQASRARVSSAARKEEKPLVPVSTNVVPANTNAVNNTTGGNVINITINNFISDSTAFQQNNSKHLPGRKLTVNSKVKKTTPASASNVDLFSLFAKSELMSSVAPEQPQIRVTQQKRPLSTASGQDRENEGWNRTPVLMEAGEPLSITGLSASKYNASFNRSAPNFRKAAPEMTTVPVKTFATSSIPASTSFNNSLAGLYQQRPSDYANRGRFLPIKVMSSARFFESSNAVAASRYSANKSFKRPASAAVGNSLKNPLESPYYHPSNSSLKLKKTKNEVQSKVKSIPSKQDGTKNVLIRSKLRSPSPADIKYYSANNFFAATH